MSDGECYLCSQCRYVDIDGTYPTSCLISGAKPEDGWCVRNMGNVHAVWNHVPTIVANVILGN